MAFCHWCFVPSYLKQSLTRSEKFLEILPYDNVFSLIPLLHLLLDFIKNDYVCFPRHGNTKLTAKALLDQPISNHTPSSSSPWFRGYLYEGPPASPLSDRLLLVLVPSTSHWLTKFSPFPSQNDTVKICSEKSIVCCRLGWLNIS